MLPPLLSRDGGHTVDTLPHAPLCHGKEDKDGKKSQITFTKT